MFCCEITRRKLARIVVVDSESVFRVRIGPKIIFVFVNAVHMRILFRVKNLTEEEARMEGICEFNWIKDSFVTSITC